jgi:hypothetical protein
MQDGDSVRVKTGKHAGLSGELVGEPSMRGVAIKLPNSSDIITVSYPPGIRTVDQLLELTLPPNTIGGISQPA